MKRARDIAKAAPPHGVAHIFSLDERAAAGKVLRHKMPRERHLPSYSEDHKQEYGRPSQLFSSPNLSVHAPVITSFASIAFEQNVVAIKVGEIRSHLIANQDLRNRNVPVEGDFTARFYIECDRAAPSEAIGGIVGNELNYSNRTECLGIDRIVADRAVRYLDLLPRLRGEP